MKRHIILTHSLFPDVIRETLKNQFTHEVVPYKNLKRKIYEADGLICLLTHKMGPAMLKNAKRLKVIGNYAVGYDNIDLTYCQKNGIRLVNTPDVLTDATAELTLALLFAVARRIPQADQYCRKGKFKGWDPKLFLGTLLQGKQAVIVGKGRIGKKVSQLFRGLGIKTLFVTRKDSSASVRFKLKKAEILSIHLPLTKTTRHWLDHSRIQCLPKNSIVLNTSRGPIIHETSLAKALRTKSIFGAGLDVFEREPKISRSLLSSDRVVLTPHIGSATESTRKEMAKLAIQGVTQILNGKTPSNEVR